MTNLHFAVVGDLAWNIDLREVVMGNYATGMATAREYSSCVSGSALTVSEICKKMRVRPSVVSSVGDDLYGHVIINYFDNLGIDSSLIAINRGQITNIKCQLNEGKKDSLIIKSPLKDNSCYNFEQLSYDIDWFFVTDHNELSQANEILHQACLRQSQVALCCYNLKKSDFRRFRYLLEDVRVLILTEKVAKQLTDRETLKVIAEILASEVEVVMIIGKRQLIARDQKTFVQVSTTTINPNVIGTSFVVNYARKKPLATAVSMACAIDNPDKQVKINEQSV